VVEILLAAGSPIRKRYRGEAWGLDMYEILAHSQVTFDRHIEAAEGFANNMRLFEATGVGAMLVTDDGKSLSELFRPAEEVVSYANETDAVRALRRFVENEDDRLRIAEAGRRGRSTSTPTRVGSRSSSSSLSRG
jgi:spore maturation protein CgeB